MVSSWIFLFVNTDLCILISTEVFPLIFKLLSVYHLFVNPDLAKSALCFVISSMMDEPRFLIVILEEGGLIAHFVNCF